jgi:hypothetical protein
MTRTYAESPAESRNILPRDLCGTAYFPETVEKGLSGSYDKVGSTINCASFSDLNSLYKTINAQTPAPIVMGQKWIMEDLHKQLVFQINGETQQILRQVRRNTGAVTSLNQTSVSQDFQIFYVPTFVNDAASADCMFDAMYVARVV